MSKLSAKQLIEVAKEMRNDMRIEASIRMVNYENKLFGLCLVIDDRPALISKCYTSRSILDKLIENELGG